MTRISKMPLLAGADIADDDLLLIVDVDDLSRPTGTDKRTTVADLAEQVGGAFQGGTVPNATTFENGVTVQGGDPQIAGGASDGSVDLAIRAVEKTSGAGAPSGVVMMGGENASADDHAQGGPVSFTGGDHGNHNGAQVFAYGANSNHNGGGDLMLSGGSTDSVDAGGDVILEGGDSTSGTKGHIVLLNLPTSDPHVAGALWNSGGVLHISAG